MLSHFKGPSMIDQAASDPPSQLFDPLLRSFILCSGAVHTWLLCYECTIISDQLAPWIKWSRWYEDLCGSELLFRSLSGNQVSSWHMCFLLHFLLLPSLLLLLAEQRVDILAHFNQYIPSQVLELGWIPMECSIWWRNINSFMSQTIQIAKF